MTQPPDYGAHENIYARLKAEGAQGWSGQEDYAAMMSQLKPVLSGLRSGANVLELGCGAGNLAMQLASLGLSVHGVDISATAVAWANERAADAGHPPNFAVDNVVTLAKYEDATFDAVVDGHCLHCIIGADRPLCMAAVRRVLKPGGLFVVLTMCGEVLNPAVLDNLDHATGVVSFNGRPARYIGTAPDLVAEIRDCGFTVIEHRIHGRQVKEDQDDLIVLARKDSP